MKIRIKAIILVQRACKAFLRLKRGNLPDDEPKRGFNFKLQEELFQASSKDQEKRKSTQVSQKVQQPKITDNLNNLDLNKEEDKSKMIEQLMEISIVTKHTKGNI